MENQRTRTIHKTLLSAGLALTFIVLSAGQALATHFRGASINWKVLSQTATQATVEFTLDISWRLGFIGGHPSNQSCTLPASYLDSVSVGTTLTRSTVNFSFGDGTNNNINLGLGTIVAHGEEYIYQNPPLNSPAFCDLHRFLVVRETFTHTYNLTNGAGTFVVGFNSCCRSSTLQLHPDQVYRVETLVVIKADGSNTGSPVTSLIPIVRFPLGAAWEVPLVVADPDGETVTCTEVFGSDIGITRAMPSAANFVVTSDCKLQANFQSPAQEGYQYAKQVQMTTASGDVAALDFIIEIWDFDPNPGFPTCTVNGPSHSIIGVGQPFSISVTGDTTLGNGPIELIPDLGAFPIIPGFPAVFEATFLYNGIPFTSPITAPNPADMTIDFTPAVVGTYVANPRIRFNNVEASCSFTLDVVDTLVADAGAEQTVDDGLPVTLDGTGSFDPSGGTLSYSWTQISGPPVDNLAGTNTANPTFTSPNVAADTVVTFELTVDNGSETDTDTVDILVLDINTPPTCTVNGPQNRIDPFTGQPTTTWFLLPNQPFSLSLTFDDPDDTQGIVEVHLPPLATLTTNGNVQPGLFFTNTPVTTTFNWTPTLADCCTNYAAQIAFFDEHGGQVVCTLPLSVQLADPVADAGPDQAVDEGDSVTLDGSSSTTPGFLGSSLTYGWTQLTGPPVVGLSGANTANPTFTAPSVAADAFVTFELTVDNGVGTDTDTVDFLVRNVNDPPVADAGPDQTVEATGALTPVTLDGSGSSDPDNDPLTYAWSGDASGTGVSLVINLSLGFHTITLTVDDGNGGTDSDTVVINVQDTTAPIVTAPPNVSAEATGPKTPVNLGNAGATDNVGVVSLTNNNPGPFSVGTHTVTWTACDAANNCGTDTQTVTVVDKEAPEFTKTQLLTELWPPNGRLKHVVTVSDVLDNVDPNPIVDIQVTHNQIGLRGDDDDDDDDDRRRGPDWKIQQVGDSWEVLVRAERFGEDRRPGRIYTITVSATDEAGNVKTQTCTVLVPHDRDDDDDDEDDDDDDDDDKKGKKKKRGDDDD